MTTQTPTLYALYRQHIDELKDERETITEAMRLFPNSWQSMYTMMNSTIKQQATKNDHC